MLAAFLPWCLALPLGVSGSYLVSVSNGKVLGSPPGHLQSGAPIEQFGAGLLSTQLWTLNQQPDGAVLIENSASGQVVAVAEPNQTNGAKLQLSPFSGAANQLWMPKQQAAGAYLFINQGSGKCLDALGMATKDGAPAGQWDCDGKQNQLWHLTEPEALPARRSVGVYYAGWHWPAWTYMNRAKEMGLPALSIETALRSRSDDGSAHGHGTTYAQLRDSRISSLAHDFFWQYDPQPGFYCIYHRRTPGSINYNATTNGDFGNGQYPDCPMYKSILALHAEQLTDMGADFVFVDMTNGADSGGGTDAIQTRPFEVMAEEWALLRQQGTPAPYVVAWQDLPQLPARPYDGRDYAIRHVMNVYNSALHGQSIMRDPITQKKILLIRGSPSHGPGMGGTI